MKARNTLLFASLVIVATSVGVHLGNRNDALAGFSSKEKIAPAFAAHHAPVLNAPDSVGGNASLTVFDSEVKWGPAVLPEKTPASAAADLAVLATALLPREKLLPAGQPKVGDEMHFAVGEPSLRGVVKAVFPDDEGHFFASGLLSGVAGGEFMLSRDNQTKTWSGRVLDRQHKLAYTFKSTAEGVRLDKLPLSAAACAMPRSPNWKPQPEAITGPEAILAAPALDSRPAARAVIYLDFDGEVVTDASWNGGLTIVAASALVGYPGVAITTAQMQDVWQRVVEDFRLFDVSVTTIRSRYDAAPDGERARVIITPTDKWYSGTAGGVALTKSYRGTAEGFSSTIPCWVFNRGNTQEIAMSISHEVGHMLNLSHDGTLFQEYYYGHDSGARSWGPLMGAPFGKSLTQWSKGEYLNADNTEDDIQVITATLAEAGFITGLIADDIGNYTAAKALTILPTITDGGVITSSTDEDAFSFRTSGGGISVTVLPQAVDGNLDADVAILDSTGTPVPGLATVLQTNVSGIKLLGTLTAAGQYFISVRGRAQPAVTGTAPVVGYSTYGSLGIYTISGTYAPAPEVPVITREPVDVTANQGANVVLSVGAISNSTMTYQWFQRIAGQPDKLLTGKTASSLSLPAIQPATAGVYFVRCHNASGDTFSRDTTVVVRYKPVITQQPLPAKQGPLAVGTMVSFTVLANGTAPITFQWKKNNIVMPGETSGTLSLGAIDWFDAGSYTCVLTNPMGTVTSAAASFTVASPPVFTAPAAFVPPVVDPTYKYIPLGGTASYTTTAVGTAPITYEWYQNGTKIASGVNKTVFAWSAIKPTAAGTYYVRAFNAVGSVTSPNFIVEVQDKPVIDAHPVAALTSQADQSVQISCAAHGTDTVATPLRYQWQLNSFNITDGSGYSGTQTNTLTINPVHWRHRGTYRCIVTNAVGTATTRNCVFTVVSYPVILTHPVTPKKIVKNGTATLSMVAGGTGTLKYQWFQKVAGQPDKLLVGKTAASLVLSKVTAPLTDGSYYCVVTLLSPAPLPGTATSNDSVVTVEDPPVPGVVISSLSRFSVGLNEPVTLSVNALGSPVLRYQWQKNNIDIPGATNATLDFAAPQFTDAGSYRVKVTNDVGFAYSAAVALKVVNKPGIIQQPASLSLYEYDNAVFSVVPSGSAPFTYQWYFNGVAITTNASAKTATLTVVGVRIITTTGGTHAGTYHCVVTNAAGTATSNNATLTITPVPGPTLSDVRPTKVSNGDSILLTGTNLNWLTGVKIGTKAIAFVKNKTTEAMITLPTGLGVTTASGPLTITTLGGTFTYPTAITVLTSGPDFDDFLNAKLVMPYQNRYRGKGNSTGATLEFNDPYYYYGRTVWLRWTAPKSGNITFRTIGTSYHHVVYIYSGPRLPMTQNELSYSSFFSNHLGNVFSDPGFVKFDVVKDMDYYFEMDAAHNDGFYGNDYGPSAVEISYNAAAPRALASANFEANQGYKLGALAGQIGWQVSGGQAAVVESTPGDQVGTVGGHAAAPIVTAWHPTGDDQITGTNVLHAAADVTVRTSLGSGEDFSFGLFDSTGRPALTLTFMAQNGSILVNPTSGSPQAITQTFVPGLKAQVAFSVDKTEGTWSILLNGSRIASGEQWQAPSGGLVSIGAAWQPADGLQTGGSIEFDNIVVTAVDAPEPPPQPPITPPEGAAH